MQDAAQELDSLIKAVPELNAPSPGKFDPIRKLLTQIVDDNDVYVVWVSRPAVLKVRLDQRGKSMRYGFALLKNEADLSGCIRAAKNADLVGAGRRAELLTFIVRTAGETWTAHTILRGAQGGPSLEPLTQAFPTIRQEVVEGSEPATPPAADSAEKLAEALCVDPAWLADVLWCVNDRTKSGIVLYGPPGTGKTYVALRIAEHIQPDPKRRRLVQMHPAYGYEDFVQGYRPIEGGSGLQLAKHNGPLCDLATSAGDQAAVMVIDELNRGNLPKVFGELFFALEYRDRPVRLMYSPKEDFRLPPKLKFIATMNTADRSVAAIDQALRRRFHFLPMFPDQQPVAGMLRTWLKKHSPAMEWVAEVLDEANVRLGNRHSAIGPSHLMRLDLDEKVLDRVWRFSVLPTIEDQFFGDEERLADFDLERLRKVVKERQS